MLEMEEEVTHKRFGRACRLGHAILCSIKDEGFEVHWPDGLKGRKGSPSKGEKLIPLSADGLSSGCFHPDHRRALSWVGFCSYKVECGR